MNQETEKEPSSNEVAASIVFKFSDTSGERYLLIEEPLTGGEKGRGNFYSLGIGGCIQRGLEEEDILDWAKSVLEREVDFHGISDLEAIEVPESESGLMGKTNLRWVIIAHARGSTPHLQMRNELRRRQLVSLRRAEGHFSLMSDLSKSVLRFLQRLERERS